MPDIDNLPALLVEQRELNNSVKLLRTRLAASVATWQRLCAKLTAAPEKVVFNNAPDDLGVFTDFPADDCCFAWHTVPDKLNIAADVRALRVALDRFKQISRVID